MNVPKTSSNVIVTGGAGFIGSEFVNEVASLPTIGKIFVIDKLTYASNPEAIRPHLDSGRVELIVDDVLLVIITGKGK